MRARILAVLTCVVLGCQVLLIGQTQVTDDAHKASIRVDTSIGWDEPALIENEEVGDAMFPKIAMNEAGYGVVAWQQTPLPEGLVHTIWVNRYSISSGWAGPEKISSTDDLDCVEVRTDIDTQGNVLAVWTAFGNGAFSIWSNKYSVGHGWGTPEMIDPNPTVSTLLADVMFDDTGNAFAFWLEYGAVKSSKYVSGTGWGPKESVSTHGVYSQPASFGLDSHGNVIAVWYDDDLYGSQTHRVWCNRYVAGIGWGTDELLMSSPGIADALVAVDDAGNAMALWYEAKTDAIFGPKNIWSSRYDVGTDWSVPELIQETTGDTWNMELAGDGSGNCIALWEELDTATIMYHLWTKRYSPSNGWSPSVEVGVSGYSANIDMDRDGLAVLAWMEWTQATVMSSRCTPQTDWSQPELVGNEGSQDLYVAVDGNGNAIAAWMWWYERSNILGNRYGTTPVTVSATIAIEPETVNMASKSKWITAFIDLPGGFDVASINVGSIRLNGQFPVTGPSDLVDYDKDKVKELMVKFDLQQIFKGNPAVASQTFTITITGWLDSGMMFEGSDTVTLLTPHTH